MNKRQGFFATLTAIALTTGGATGAQAQMQDWRGNWRTPNWGSGIPGGSVYAPGERDRILVERTCNGRFLAILDSRVARERQHGSLRRDEAERVRHDLRRLDDRGRWACRNRDWRAARETGEQFMRISHWLDRETRRRWDERW
ncbi:MULTISPECIES: hypothetical protein [Novosphingobium]|uniref:hypothetical protein n=1 Tax=Novosphingobium TaxID=165696 RepID=UPI001CD306DD|nr:hypothetical protein [Novosphingobium percolationis]